MALVSVATLKTFLGITDTSEDAQLALWAGYADADIKDYVGWDIESTPYPGAATNGRGDSGYYVGEGTEFLSLRQTPVTSITAVYADTTGNFGDNPDGAFDSSTLLIAGQDYVLHWDGCLPGTSTRCSYSGLLERVPTVWYGRARRQFGQINSRATDSPGNIKVQYVAGYTTVPPAIELAACMLVSMIRRTAPYGGAGLQSENLGSYSYSLSSPVSGQYPELGTIRQALARYKRMVV